nr:hypothetical protein [Acinetobacter baumannii]KAB1091247.1 hypothetical protein F6W77_19515 [Acinetobacter baumannii]
MHILCVYVCILFLGMVSAIDQTLNSKSDVDKNEKPDQNIAESVFYGQQYPVGYGGYPQQHIPTLGVHSEVTYANHKPLYNGYYYKPPITEFYKKPFVHHADGFTSNLMKPLFGSHGHDDYNYNHLPQQGKYDEIPVLRNYA